MWIGRSTVMTRVVLFGLIFAVLVHGEAAAQKPGAIGSTKPPPVPKSFPVDATVKRAGPPGGGGGSGTSGAAAPGSKPIIKLPDPFRVTAIATRLPASTGGVVDASLINVAPRSGFVPYDANSIVRQMAAGGGDSCPCVILDHTLKVEKFKAGDIISLGRIEGGDPAEVGEAGCPPSHLHLLIPFIGIFIDNDGPFSDPKPSGCGYGKIKG